MGSVSIKTRQSSIELIHSDRISQSPSLIAIVRLLLRLSIRRKDTAFVLMTLPFRCLAVLVTSGIALALAHVDSRSAIWKKHKKKQTR
jgi:hypothetical protein